jgi:eukaryotic-like serine/threonine-protein kinase
MSEVYRGFDLRLRRPVAIKRLRADLAINPVFRARFRREAQAAGSLSHSAIVAVYDTGEERDETGSSIPFIVMELVEGTLPARCAAGGTDTLAR